MKASPLHLAFMLLYGRSILPRPIQIRLRQRICRRILARNSHIWPIDERAGRTPDGWPGWPDGKQFAFVLTHDVDTQRGLDRCRALMDLEESLGFRSAFYFVPRGRYPVPHDLMRELKSRGFEVGVHGLYHDWWTFTFRNVFEKRAPLIRQYMKEWDCRGFRAPSTVRNLDWIGELGVEYDTSAFDTDPFEPLPEGTRTIFPFVVRGNAADAGYIELPYTMPQDLTLFVLIQQSSPAVWIRKLDWIVGRGGMAMLDTHPDYMSPDRLLACDEYPHSYYRDFLEHTARTYRDQYWHTLPSEAAAFFRAAYRSLTV